MHLDSSLLSEWIALSNFVYSFIAALTVLFCTAIIGSPSKPSTQFMLQYFPAWLLSARKVLRPFIPSFNLQSDNPLLYKSLIFKLGVSTLHALLVYLSLPARWSFAVSKLSLYEFLLTKSIAVSWGMDPSLAWCRRMLRCAAWISAAIQMLSFPVIYFCAFDAFVNAGFLFLFCFPIVQTLSWRTATSSTLDEEKDRKLYGVVGRNSKACGISLLGTLLLAVSTADSDILFDLLSSTSVSLDTIALLYTTMSAWNMYPTTPHSSTPTKLTQVNARQGI